VFARAEVNAFLQKKGQAARSYVCVRALNEFDSKATGADCCDYCCFRPKLFVFPTRNFNTGRVFISWLGSCLPPDS
jgi:hypothetical protein